MFKSHVRWTEPRALTVRFTYCIYFNHRRLHCYNLVTTAENRRNHAIREQYDVNTIQDCTASVQMQNLVTPYAQNVCMMVVLELLFLIVVLF